MCEYLPDLVGQKDEKFPLSYGGSSQHRSRSASPSRTERRQRLRSRSPVLGHEEGGKKGDRHSENGVVYLSWRYSIGDKAPSDDELAGYRLLLENKFLKAHCKHWVYQLEATAEKDHDWDDQPAGDAWSALAASVPSAPKPLGNYHFQGYCQLKVKKRPKSLAISLNGDLKGIDIRAASNNGREALKNYVMKEETRQQGPWADKPIRKYEGIFDLKADQLQPWEHHVMANVKSKNRTDNRTINWVCDSKGGRGKSTFCGHLVDNYDAFLLNYGDAKDMLNLVSKNMGYTSYVFDLARTKPSEFSSNDIYYTLEQVKNGRIINLKYETSTSKMDSPHVWVFANQWPVVNKMSYDRWACWFIGDDDLELHPYDIAKIADSQKK